MSPPGRPKGSYRSAQHEGSPVTPAAAYPLLRDGAEHRRLAEQAAFWAVDASALFDAAGVRAGDRVADLGCGTPHLALALARRVGTRGSVLALDSDERIVAEAARSARPRQMVVMAGDAYATPWTDASLDAVHARFVAALCGRVDALIAEMLRVVRPGGLVMLQEPVADTWHVPAAGDAWPRLRALIRAGFRRRGGDFDAGRALRRRLGRALGSVVHERRAVHTIPAAHPYAALPLAFCDSLHVSWREARLIAEDELRLLRDGIEAGLRGPQATVTTFALVQVWGRKT